jgi:hypothetical protein
MRSRLSKGVFRISRVFLRLLDVGEQLSEVLTPIFVGRELEQAAITFKVLAANEFVHDAGCPMDRMTLLSAAGVLTQLRFR